MSLEKMVKRMTKTMVVSDLHGDFVDENAFEIAMAYAKDYKPNNLVINGDMLDFYGLSVFDKNPDRKSYLSSELQKGRELLDRMRESVGKKCKIIYLEGNHENRLQKFVWRNPEMEGMTELKLEKLLDLKDRDVKFVGVENDYWRNSNGHYQIGDAIIAHGDNRTNGCSTSQYSGYSAKNTMMKMQSSVVLGHVHRLAIVNHTTPYGDLVGVEAGCLCQKSGMANWQQGFVTFETIGNKNKNYRTHKIEDDKLYVDGTTYFIK